MTQNHLLILALVELIIFYLIIYSLIKTNKWVNEKQRNIEELTIELPEIIRNFRNNINDLNNKFKENLAPKPLSSQELGVLVGSILTDIATSKIPFMPKKNKFAIFSIFFRLWQNRHRLKATITNQLN